MRKTGHYTTITTTRRPDRAAGSEQSWAFTLGRRAFAKVSAVEGIRVPSDMEADFLRLDELELDARRHALAEKYGKR